MSDKWSTLRSAVRQQAKRADGRPEVTVNRQTRAADQRAEGLLDALANGASASGQVLTDDDGQLYFMLDRSVLDGPDPLE